MIHEISLETNNRTELIDITSKVNSLISSSNVKEGTCLIFVPHTTAGIAINENADSSVKSDIIKELNKVIPFDDNYQHAEGNSAAHIKSVLCGIDLNIIIKNSQLVLGTWQGVYFCEFDGPRSRKVIIKIN
jgi:secondary thiamine-phosphate synthase enzyme